MSNSKIRTWLTAFAEFTAKFGTSRVVCVNTTKKRAAQRLTRGSIYYLGVKEACQEADPGNARELMEDAVDAAVADRRGHYAKVGVAFCQWLESLRSYRRLTGVAGSWTCGELTVGVSPELHVEIDGVEHLIKLYFRGRPIAKQEAFACNTLMRAALGDKVGRDCRIAVLDVRAVKLHVEKLSDFKRGLIAMRAEAAAFVAIWRELPDPGAQSEAA
jgi:hypothetical protein